MARTCVLMRQEELFTPGKPGGQTLDTSLITSTVRKRKANSADLPPPSAQPVDESKRQRTPPADRGLLHGSADGSVRVTVAGSRASSATPPAVEQAGGVVQQGGVLQPGDSPNACLAPQPPVGEAAEAEDAALFSPSFQLAKGAPSSKPSDCSSICAAAALLPASTALVPPAIAPAVCDAVTEAGVPSPPLTQQPPLQWKQQPEGAIEDEEVERTSTDHSTGTSASLGGASAGGDPAGSEAVADSVLAASTPSPQPAQPPLSLPVVAVCALCSAPPDDADEYLEFDPLLFIKRLPPLDRCVPPRRDFLLPKKTRRSKLKTLVLDLDETLVHSTLDGYCRPDFTFPVEVGPMRHMVSVRQRPHLHTFLGRVSQLFEVVVFTASQRVYAEQLLNIVDPERRLVRHRVYRESCVLWEGNYMKDLTVLGRDLAHTIIVDNSPQAFGFQLDNGIPIESWYDDDADEELLKLIPFLEGVAHVDDVRPHIQKRYRLRSLVDSAAERDTCSCIHLQTPQ